MSDTPDPKEAITDELSDQVDVGSLVKGESVGDQVDGESLGQSFGESVGALAGRKLGNLAAGRLLSKIPFQGGDDENPSLLRRLASALAVALGKTLSQPKFRDPIESSLREYVKNREAAETLDDAKETAEQVAETLDEEGESEEPTEENSGDDDAKEDSDDGDAEEESGDDEAEDEQEAEGDTGEGNTDASDINLNPDDVQAIREETYRELLETMDYSELQSVAKEVGVKANLGRDDMVDAIVKQFNDDSESDDGGDESESE